jgi:hypothetical protein
MSVAFSKESVRERLVGLGLPPAVTDIYDHGGEAVHPLLRDAVHDPYYVWDAQGEAEDGELAEVAELLGYRHWEAFVRACREQPGDMHEVLASHVDALEAGK